MGLYYLFGLSWQLSGKEPNCQCRTRGFDPWVGKIPWRRERQPTPVFLPGKSHEQRSLTGYSSVQFISVAQSCPTLCYPMDCSPPGSSVHRILQARVLGWRVIPSFRRFSAPRDQSQVSCTAGRFFTI